VLIGIGNVELQRDARVDSPIPPGPAWYRMRWKMPGIKLRQYKSSAKFLEFNVSGWKIGAKNWLLR